MRAFTGARKYNTWTGCLDDLSFRSPFYWVGSLGHKLLNTQCAVGAFFFRRLENFLRKLMVDSEITQIAKQIEAGKPRAADELLAIVYDELRRLASRRLARELPGQTWQTTELVHEAYLRLVGGEQKWDGRAHFFAAAAEAMRRILVERARRKQRAKRGGGRHRIQLHESAVEDGTRPHEILLVNDLFDEFEREHPPEAEVAKLRYFAGFNLSETARTLEISVTTSHRYWVFARAWFFEKLR